jgi:hypothetical protein
VYRIGTAHNPEVAGSYPVPATAEGAGNGAVRVSLSRYPPELLAKAAREVVTWGDCRSVRESLHGSRRTEFRTAEQGAPPLRARSRACEVTRMSAIEGTVEVEGRWWSGRFFESPSLLLFMSVFTSQAAVLVLSPILVDLARDLDVSTAAAGQLRVLAAPVAAVVAVVLTRSAARLPLRSLLGAGAALVAGGSLASAAAPSFVVLALAQVPLWIGVAVLVVGGVGAAGSWSAPGAAKPCRGARLGGGAGGVDRGHAGDRARRRR